MSRIKIIHIITSLHGDGAQHVLFRLLSKLDKDRFESLVINLRAHTPLADQFEANGIPVHSIGLKANFKIFSCLAYLIKAIKQFKPQIIQGWMYHGNLIASLLQFAVKPRPKVIWNIRRSVYARGEDKLSTAIIIKLNAYFSRTPEKIIYCANEVLQQHQKIKFDLTNSKLIPNGFDVNRYFPSLESATFLRNIIGVSLDTLIVGSVGRFHPQKDYDNFLKAAEITHKRHPRAHFVLIGHDLDNENEHLNKLIQAYGLKDVFHLLGRREDIHKLVPGFDIFCSSSCMEGFANVVGEAMACEVPCVVTDTGASREVVEGLGRVVARRNSQQLAEALIEMIDLGKEKRAELGKKSRERIAREYSFDSIVSEYQKIYLGLAK